MKDLIDRQAAIKALHDEIVRRRISEDVSEDANDCGALDEFDTEAILRRLPSEEPEIIRCKDCICQTESWSGIKYCEAHGDHIGKDYDYCSNARRKTNGIL